VCSSAEFLLRAHRLLPFSPPAPWRLDVQQKAPVNHAMPWLVRSPWLFVAPVVWSRRSMSASIGTLFPAQNRAHAAFLAHVDNARRLNGLDDVVGEPTFACDAPLALSPNCVLLRGNFTPINVRQRLVGETFTLQSNKIIQRNGEGHWKRDVLWRAMDLEECPRAWNSFDSV
jgi:hypothetical protein